MDGAADTQMAAFLVLLRAKASPCIAPPHVSRLSDELRTAMGHLPELSIHWIAEYLCAADAGSLIEALWLSILSLLQAQLHLI